MSLSAESSHYRIWRIAFPGFLASLSGGLVGVVDIWAIGNMGQEEEMAGLAVGAFFMIMVHMLFSFFYLSSVGLIAQSFGAKKRRVILEVFLRAFLLAIASGLVIIVFSPSISKTVVAIWQPSVEAAQESSSYLGIRLLGAPAIFLSMVIRGYLIGVQHARQAFFLDLLLTILNTLLTLMFVLGLGWGVKGAAVGSLAAELAATAAGLSLTIKALRPSRISMVIRGPVFWKFREFRAQISVNAYIFIRTLFIQVVFTSISVAGARMGDTVLAANHILMQLIFVVSQGLVGMNSATQALVGEAKGKGDSQLFNFWVLRTAGWSLVLAVFFSFIYGMYGSDIISGFTDVLAIAAAADEQLVLIVLWPVLAVWAYHLDAVFVGAAGAKYMMWAAALSTATFFISLSILLPLLENRGLWLALIVFFISRTLVLAMVYPALLRGIRQKAD